MISLAGRLVAAISRQLVQHFVFRCEARIPNEPLVNRPSGQAIDQLVLSLIRSILVENPQAFPQPVEHDRSFPSRRSPDSSPSPDLEAGLFGAVQIALVVMSGACIPR
jgi:hypothetical protein